ncbi:MAG: T9SS type A sorting domain-containing protein, partial [Bacteroidia bacterium]|nr:T9SS type A sorting domain-containing protein [Bacteroidia bacterium]
SDYYSINKSTDGEHYEAVGTVKSNNSKTGGSYTFYDNNPTLGNSYYTLTSIDFDGSQSVSNIVSVQFLDSTKAYIFYNNNGTFQIQPLNQVVLTQINIYSLMGQLLKTVPVNNNLPINIDVSQLAKGQYYAQINSQNSTYTERFVVE